MPAVIQSAVQGPKGVFEKVLKHPPFGNISSPESHLSLTKQGQCTVSLCNPYI